LPSSTINLNPPTFLYLCAVAVDGLFLPADRFTSFFRDVADSGYFHVWMFMCMVGDITSLLDESLINFSYYKPAHSPLFDCTVAVPGLSILVDSLVVLRRRESPETIPVGGGEKRREEGLERCFCLLTNESSVATLVLSTIVGEKNPLDPSAVYKLYIPPIGVIVFLKKEWCT